MPKLRERNRTSRKVHFTTPGGSNKTRYQERADSDPVCAETGKRLHGVQDGPKSYRRPERPYGGVLISEAARRRIIDQVRELADDGDGKGYGPIGRVCVKTAGRDAGKQCVIVEQKDDGRVVIDGETRRRTVSLKHLEPLSQTYDIEEGISHEDLKDVVDFEVRDTESRETPERPKKQKVEKEAPRTTSTTEEEDTDTVEAVKEELGEDAGDEDDVSLAAHADEVVDTEAGHESVDEHGDEEQTEEKEIPARSTIANKTKDDIKEYAKEEWGVELSTNDLKDEMIDQLFDEIE